MLRLSTTHSLRNAFILLTLLAAACGSPTATPAPGAPASAMIASSASMQIAHSHGPLGTLRMVYAPPVLDAIFGTGQSLSLGHGSYGVIDTTPSKTGLMFASGTRAGLVDDGNASKVLSMSALSSLVPLNESGQEDMAAGLTGSLPTPTLVAELGVSAMPYSKLRKGTQAYANLITAVIAANVAAAKQGKSLNVRAMTCVHGESDEQVGTTAAQYESYLLEWHDDFCADVKEITHQLTCPILLTDQMSSWTRLDDGTLSTARVPYGQLAAFLDHPDKIRLVGPKYFLHYLSDGVHLTAASEKLLGQYYARALSYDMAVYPLNATLVGSTIVVRFHEAAPLVIDRTTVTDPNGQAGFEFHDDSNSAHIISVAVTPDHRGVAITLNRPFPTGGHPRVRYAFTGWPGANAGPTSGPRGCLRDNNAAMPDWAVHFDIPLQMPTPVATPSATPTATPTPGPVW